MEWTRPRTADDIPIRLRTVVDTSEMTTTIDAIRSESMRATMDLITKLSSMGCGERFDATIRGLMVIGYSVPIKAMCVGLYPYERDILPPIATSLAYSPIKCNGVTPSVQILSQAMAIVAKSYRDRVSKKSKVGQAVKTVDDAGLVARFAMMLRCSYLCSVIGVAFINCVPVPVDNMAKRVRCASLFSEWLGRMIKIHDSYGFRMSIVAMGEFASDSVRNTFSSYRGTNTKVSYVGARNPAAIAYMNIHKHPAASPITSSITGVETKIYMDMGVSGYPIPNIEYEWKIYPKDVLYTFMKELPIAPLARALVDHTVEELLEPFTIMSKNLFSNMGGIPAGYRPGAIPDTDDTHSVMSGNITTNANTGTAQPMGQAPTGSIFVQSGQNRPMSGGENQGMGGQTGFNQSMNDKTFFVGRNSIIAQMNDTTGKSKSQQVIVIENMVTKLEHILESFRSREKTIGKMIDIMETIVDRHSVEDDELDEIITVVKERFPEELRELEEATAIVAAMPALIEGDTGVIEGMIQPSAPLMRRHDGTTMRDGVYEQMTLDRSTGVAQARNPPESTGVFSTTEAVRQQHETNTTNNRNTRMTFDPNPVLTDLQPIGSDMVITATDMFMEAIEKHGTDEMLDAVMWEMPEFGADGSTMMDVMTMAMARFMTIKNNESALTDKMTKSLIELMTPVTEENFSEIGSMIKELMDDSDSLVSLFEDDLS